MKYNDTQTIKLTPPESEDGLKQLIYENETAYQNSLKAALEFLLSSHKKVITLAGPSCSGKTTTANYIVDGLEKNGKHIKVLSIDDFFRSRKNERLAVGETEDLDSVNAIDLDYLAECIARLASGQTALLPTFDFNRGIRSALTPYTPGEDDIYLFEGIQAVYKEVTELLDPLGKSSVFINVESAIVAPKCEFSKFEIRLIRRLLRDRLFRSSPCEFTLFQWSSVRENEDRSILPRADETDFRINSLIPYEMFLYAKRLPSLLDETDSSSPHYAAAVEIKEKLLTLLPNPLDEELIPENSLLREFIGRKTNNLSGGRK